MEIKFIKVKCITGFHIIRLDEIMHISPMEGNQNKTKIVLKNESSLYSTETQEEIFFAIELTK